MAHQYLRKARPNHTLQSTALVHEAYLRLEKYRPTPFQNRAHFVAVCALLMRQILTGYERTRWAAKRGGGGQNLTLDDASALMKGRPVDLRPVWIRTEPDRRVALLRRIVNRRNGRADGNFSSHSEAPLVWLHREMSRAKQQ